MADSVVVRVRTAVVDPEPFLTRKTASPPVGAFVGTVERSPSGAVLEPGAAVVGVGPLGGQLTLSPTDLWTVHEGELSHTALALLPFVGPIVDGLAAVGVGVGERALVSGRGLTARLAAEAMERVTGRAPARLTPGERAAEEPVDPVEVDVLVDATGDPAWWGRVLPRVRREGRVLLLIPPGPQLHSFDFYHRVHRGSFTLAVRRVPARGDLAAAVAVLNRMLSDGALAPADVLHGLAGGYEPAGGFPRLDSVPAGMGLAVRFDTMLNGVRLGGKG